MTLTQEQQTTDIEKTLKRILSCFKKQKDRMLIERAFVMARNAHEGQFRKSGEPYVVHPLDAALTLALMHLDPSTVAAAMLHDVVEDTNITEKELEKEFGEEISFLVNGVTKLGKLKYRGAERHAENLRKMLLAMAEDIRVVLIKFADRLHNMKTLSALPEAKRRRIALETMEIYAPIAMRLGVAEIAKQLEDLAFPHLYPDEYKFIDEEVKKRYPARGQYLDRVKPMLLRELKKEKIVPLEVHARAKHMYSLWRKLQKYDYNWDAIHDLVAARIIVKSIEECYAALGVIHKLWKPLPGRIKDYIALPKGNGYQSLHTTVFCVDGVTTEFQIRTPEMHEHAENGIAAHWAYNEKGKPNKGAKANDPKLSWVRQISDWQKEIAESEELMENLKIDIFKDRIFVFSPRGDVFDLPEGATPVDFAYAIHSTLGDECGGAQVNGKMVPLNYELQSGDVIEIIRAKGREPSRAWLEFVKTNQARSHIRTWLKKKNRDENLLRGLEIINRELELYKQLSWDKLPKEKKEELLSHLASKTLDDILIGVGLGEISLQRVIRYLVDEKDVFTDKIQPVTLEKKNKGNDSFPIRISGQKGMKGRVAQCCTPIAGEPIIAYITVRSGASIHKKNCHSVRTVKEDGRLLPAYWDKASQAKAALVSLVVFCYDRVGLMQDISTVAANQNINIATLSVRTENDVAAISLTIEVRSLEELRGFISKIKAIRDVREVKRA
ncbi:MAG: bifunctional (p)ppGpp synthetase/guanosine-3',5'-bis(diphosphate) 3'-pyrophosphohydrolase [Candidatus Spechtbacteria bacterium]|nr:bifunctional (p)ppGpp synthetase/guanosine-3',5'-bis(diphosphate) 3'-pyrophosphohydrolase [Candidatus Spechtbacteria bacterium]